MKKLLTIGIILLFIGVAVAPSINSTVVKASTENDLVEVTSQACGIQGFRNTTVKLTKQQYQNLEQYLVDFRARLNQTTTREEAVPIFKEAVVELNKYGLLPKGMSIERVQRMITTDNKLHNVGLIFNKFQQDNINVNCLFAGLFHGYSVDVNIWIWLALFFYFFALAFPYYSALWSLFMNIGYAFDLFSKYKPLRFMNVMDLSSINYDSFYSIGKLGIQQGQFDFGVAFGFTGLKISYKHVGEQYEFYLGYALRITKDSS